MKRRICERVHYMTSLTIFLQNIFLGESAALVCFNSHWGTKIFALLPKFIMKADGRHKFRLVAGEYVTGEPMHKVYSSNLKTKNMKIFFVIAH